jgi:hypothetical protein
MIQPYKETAHTGSSGIPALQRRKAITRFLIETARNDAEPETSPDYGDVISVQEKIPEKNRITSIPGCR